MTGLGPSLRFWSFFQKLRGLNASQDPISPFGPLPPGFAYVTSVGIFVTVGSAFVISPVVP